MKEGHYTIRESMHISKMKIDLSHMININVNSNNIDCSNKPTYSTAKYGEKPPDSASVDNRLLLFIIVILSTIIVYLCLKLNMFAVPDLIELFLPIFCEKLFTHFCKFTAMILQK